MDVSGKVAVVTGAARGIGLAYVRAFLEGGARVAAADILGFELLEREIEGAFGEDRLLTLHTDVTSSGSVSDMTDRVLQKWGRIDALVNNAALYGGLTRAPLEEIPEDEWDRLMAINVKGVWLCTKAVLPAMKSQRSGSIVNISSSTVLSGTPNFLHYVTSKGAILAMTRSTATEAGDYGIRVNSVTPGFVSSEASKTNYGPGEFEKHAARRAEQRVLKREMMPEDLTDTVLFLTSDASRFITGQNINVDGGSSFY